MRKQELPVVVVVDDDLSFLLEEGSNWKEGMKEGKKDLQRLR